MVLFLLAGVWAASAQAFEVQGVVLDASEGTPLPGVNIVEVGTQNGTTSNTDGEFTLAVAGPNATLRFSFVGFEAMTVSVNGRSELTVEMEPRTEELEGVVVTALGIERQQKSVGYSISKVSGEELSEVETPNLGDALSGKVAGVDVSNTATGPGGSSRVIIRGVSSLTGDNQPLYVVDGVPLDNSNLVSAGMWGGSDLGDGLSALNPNDVEEVSVLKGAAAAALYGERASNGVVLITTKSGSSAGLGIEFSSTTTFERALDYFDEFQYEYGQGTQGRKPETVEEAQSTGLSSWGARLDGSMVPQYDGEERPYSAVRDNLSEFYETGINTTNTVALNGGNEETTFRFSVSNRQDQSIVPNSDYERTTFLLRASSSFGVPGLRADVKANYVREEANNRPRLSDSPGNPNYSVGLLPTNVPVEILKPGWVGDDRFQEFQFTGSQFITNPYWAVNRFSEKDVDDRVTGFAELSYDILDWLAVRGRIENDIYWTRRTQIEPRGTAYDNGGDISENEWNVQEINANFLFTANHEVTSSIAVSGRFGGNIKKRDFEQIGAFGDNFNIPGLQTVANTESQSPTYGFSEEQTNSLFGEAEVSYNDYLFLSLTGRNDWASTLPVDNNSYFYPSVSGSFVFSEALATPDWLSYGKVRGSWAQVGGDTDPYRLSLSYELIGQGHLGNPIGQIASGSVPNADLQPYIKTDIEGGFELGFFDERLGLDFTVYQSTITNDIVPTSISPTAGYGSRILNVGKTRNRGVEIFLRTVPVEMADFEWNLDLNAAKNQNEVVSLAEGMESLFLGEGRTRNAFIEAQEGEPYGAIVGFTFKRDDQGRLVLDGDGLPQASDATSVVGNYTPDWRGGITNSLRYKNLSLRALVDVQIGGDIYSATNVYATNNGLHKNTLRGRENGITLEGVDESGNPMTATVTAQNYFQRIAFNITEEFVYDASYVKLRELRLGYRIPQSFLNRTPLQTASLALTGRNLWVIHKNTPNIDPEATYNRNSDQQGLEMFGVPQTRSLGLSVNLRF